MAVEIDDKFEDVDFTDPNNWPEENKLHGEPVCGDLGGTFETPCGNYELAEPILTFSEIDAAIEALDAEPESSLEFLVRRIYNQLREGSCVGNAGTHGLELVGRKEFGDLMDELAAISLYKQIGRSAQSGAMVSDAMEKIRDVGVLPLDTPKNRAKYGNHVMPATGFGTPWPSGWKETAAKFRGAEFLAIRNSVQQIFSAVCKGHPVIVGRQGHSILYLRPLPNRKFLYVNSWGNWGQAAGHMPSGFGVDSASQVKQSASWAFAIRAGSIQLAA